MLPECAECISCGIQTDLDICCGQGPLQTLCGGCAAALGICRTCNRKANLPSLELRGEMHARRQRVMAGCQGHAPSEALSLLPPLATHCEECNLFKKPSSFTVDPRILELEAHWEGLDWLVKAAR
mmetsp:Transcript_57514/g.125047  ORF Transcript_57514/g.125047 Transcript_57514/m.125047 type:complete len:125 (-) Transcript_57514:129-503(-)